MPLRRIGMLKDIHKCFDQQRSVWIQILFHEHPKNKPSVLKTRSKHWPTRSSCPKTVRSPSAEQFQRPYLNWYWHSLMPSCAPSPITMMASGRLWQIARWRGARPGILLQMMFAPRATTEERALWDKRDKH